MNSLLFCPSCLEDADPNTLAFTEVEIYQEMSYVAKLTLALLLSGLSGL